MNKFLMAMCMLIGCGPQEIDAYKGSRFPATTEIVLDLGDNLINHPCAYTFMVFLNEGSVVWNPLGGAVYRSWTDYVPSNVRHVSINVAGPDLDPGYLGIYSGDIFIREAAVCTPLEDKNELFSTLDMRHILTVCLAAHEIGHALGLPHLDIDKNGIMNPIVGLNSVPTENDWGLWNNTFNKD